MSVTRVDGGNVAEHAEPGQSMPGGSERTTPVPSTFTVRDAACGSSDAEGDEPTDAGVEPAVEPGSLLHAATRSVNHTKNEPRGVMSGAG
jgi:hypothetical protein